MAMCRFMLVLILSCVLDLVMPVVPTTSGVELEKDEEVVRVASWRPPRPLMSTRTRDDRGARLARQRVAAAPTAPRAAREASPAAPRTHVAIADSPSPPASGEDH